MLLRLQRETVTPNRGMLRDGFGLSLLLLLPSFFFVGTYFRGFFDSRRFVEPTYVPAAVPTPDPPAPACETTEIRSTLSRTLVDQWLAKPEGLAGMARIIPRIHDGATTGFKLYAIRPESPAAIIGIHNGDTLHKVNGIGLTKPDYALYLYTELSHVDHFTLELTRGGCPLTIRVTIL